ncbi:major facilitator transporter [Carbonactinospora thermoautotrophica]|uniref:Major facilitator transporter n=1 Tax=Carbonactinospora thermoautotrophica TaxID=1469144 RepID=A0A132MIQ5_9ACTN|nr:sugar porter family MFS transporter [Carbonactinospora thermoautotrophica]KWW97705.1 major facilitator transporter [Carbonactinospora thermoautotrophica]KWW97718.1 major facilitator transporter [Carbonactinospora thermoautotrophica]KWX10388.1 major facilitator transporter [Carbonactinospora thermoautotrophica]
MSDHGTWREPAAPWTAEEVGVSPGVAVLVASVAALGGLLFGYDTAVINGAVGAIDDRFNASSLALGLTVSAALIGSAVGALLAGRLADRYGRLHTMRVAAALFLVSAVGSGLAWSLLTLAVFRVVGGVAVGIASVIAPAYIAEISPARIRGRLGSLQQLAIVSGIFLALLVDYAIAAAAGGSMADFALGLEAWRWMFLAMTVPAVVYGVLSLTIPESPRHLVAKGRIEEARAVLRRLLGEAGLDHKIAQIRETLTLERPPSMRDLHGPALGLLPIVWVGIGLSVFQQFVGINVIFYYSSVLWQAVGFSEGNALLITVITSVVNILTTLVAIALIDRLGRRPLLLIGSAGMAVTLGILSFVFANAPLNAQGLPELAGAAGPIALLAANVFVFAFGMSWGPVVWVLLGETFPNRIRAAALSVAAAAQWIANWVVSTTFPSLKDAGLGLAYGIYTAAAVLSFFFVLKFVRETKGRELEEMGR